MLKALLESKRSTKRLISVLYDVYAIIFAAYIAVCLRLGTFAFEVSSKELLTLGITITVSIVVFIKLGLYRAIIRYMTAQAMISIIMGVCISSLVLAASSFFTRSFVPRSVPFIYISTALLFIGTPRLFIRSIIALLYQDKTTEQEPVIIYGAGYTGHQLALSLRAQSPGIRRDRLRQGQVPQRTGHTPRRPQHPRRRALPQIPPTVLRSRRPSRPRQCETGANDR